MLAQEKNRKNRGIYGFILVSIFSFFVAEASQIRLSGIGNYFELLRTAVTERPSIRISKIGSKAANVFINPQSYRGQLQVVDVPLPIEVEVRFNTYNSGQPFIIVIERIERGQGELACQGVSMVTVKASIKGRAGSTQKICVPISSSPLLSAGSPLYPGGSPIYSGDFNTISLFIGPLGVNDAYDPDDVKSLPFRFGLMSWTSLMPPWNNAKINATFDSRNILFKKPLEVLQGFAALGGGSIPRAYHGSIAHIFNDTDNIILLSRESKSKELAPYNISQVIPPHSIMPYVLLWIPKVKNKTELSFSGHAGIRIAALKKGQTARDPDTISHSEIREFSPMSAIEIPEELKALEALIARSTLPMSNDASDLLGVTFWNKDMKSAYADFDAARYYYLISTDQEAKVTYMQKCSVVDNTCSEVSKIDNPAAYDIHGNPAYYNMIIKSNKESSFDIEMYESKIRPPKDR